MSDTRVFLGDTTYTHRVSLPLQIGKMRLGGHLPRELSLEVIISNEQMMAHETGSARKGSPAMALIEGVPDANTGDDYDGSQTTTIHVLKVLTGEDAQWRQQAVHLPWRDDSEEVHLPGDLALTFEGGQVHIWERTFSQDDDPS